MAVLLVLLQWPSITAAQDQPAPAPPPGWAGSASSGVALTSGNSDTVTINGAYELRLDRGGPITFRSTGLLVWGRADGLLTSDHLTLDWRVEGKLSDRGSAFAQTQYLRDTFKSIDYLIAPTVGLSRMVRKNERTELSIDAAVGGVWERNPATRTDLDAAVTAGEKFSRKLTDTTEFSQRLNALWKMDDFSDALYTLGAAVGLRVTAAMQVKIELIDNYKTRPPAAAVRVHKNDVATLLSLVYRFD